LSSLHVSTSRYGLLSSWSCLQAHTCVNAADCLYRLASRVSTYTGCHQAHTGHLAPRQPVYPGCTGRIHPALQADAADGIAFLQPWALMKAGREQEAGTCVRLYFRLVFHPLPDLGCVDWRGCQPRSVAQFVAGGIYTNHCSSIEAATQRPNQVGLPDSGHPYLL
jgi:hypothetical protein